MASSSILASEGGRSLETLWFPECVCNVEMEDLFSIPGVPVRELDFSWGEIRGGDFVIEKENRVYLKYTEESMGDFILNSDKEEIFILGGGNIIPSTLSRQVFRQKKQEFYNNLIIKPETLEVINNFWEPFKNKSILGLQIRGSDHVDLFHGDLRRGSANKIKNMVETALKEVKGEKYDHLFIASDEPEVVEGLLSQLPNSFSYSAGGSSRHSTEGMITALVDWWLLGRCNKIIYSKVSSFGEEAAVRAGALDSRAFVPLTEESDS